MSQLIPYLSITDAILIHIKAKKTVHVSAGSTLLLGPYLGPITQALGGPTVSKRRGCESGSTLGANSVLMQSFRTDLGRRVYTHCEHERLQRPEHPVEASQIGGDHTHRHGAHSEEEGWPLAIDHQVGALQLVEEVERRSKPNEYNSFSTLCVPGRPEAPPHQSPGRPEAPPHQSPGRPEAPPHQS